jgi:hypothetical protein
MLIKHVTEERSVLLVFSSKDTPGNMQSIKWVYWSAEDVWGRLCWNVISYYKN